MTNYVLNEEKMFADITDGVAIVINSETGIYYGMNNLGTAVFENLINGASTDDVLAKLKGFGVKEENFKTFIDALVEKELVVAGGTGGVAVAIDEAVAKEDNFEITLSEYNDAQELLLADPIHEVKEETGWTPEKDSIGYTKEETAAREEKMKV